MARMRRAKDRITQITATAMMAAVLCALLCPFGGGEGDAWGELMGVDDGGAAASWVEGRFVDADAPTEDSDVGGEREDASDPDVVGEAVAELASTVA